MGMLYDWNEHKIQNPWKVFTRLHDTIGNWQLMVVATSPKNFA